MIAAMNTVACTLPHTRGSRAISRFMPTKNQNTMYIAMPTATPRDVSPPAYCLYQLTSVPLSAT
ncbi:hypothetical protein D3C81_2321670 [compost metagenome]